MFLKMMMCICVIMLVCTGTVVAKENVMGLDSTNTFNVYISNGAGGLSAIKNVNIEDVRVISGITFLVIRDKGFNSAATEGIVRLDAVQAVVPTLRALSIQTVTGDIK